VNCINALFGAFVLVRNIFNFVQFFYSNIFLCDNIKDVG
jgi:hypothetical protein